MKKILISLITLTLVLAIFSSCRKTPQELSINTAKHFLEKLYETPAEDFSFIIDKKLSPEEMRNLGLEYTDTFRDYFTEEGFLFANNNRLFLYSSNYLLNTENIINVDKITFTKIDKDKKVLTDKDMIFTNIDIKYHVTKKNGDILPFTDSISINLLEEDGKWRIDYVSLSIFLSMRDEFSEVRDILRSKELLKKTFKELYTQSPENLSYFLNHPLPDEEYESIPNTEGVKRRNELFKPLLELQSKDYKDNSPLSQHYYHCIDNNLNIDFVSMNFSSCDTSSTADDNRIYTLEFSVEYKTTSNDNGVVSLYKDIYQTDMIKEKDGLKILYMKSDKESLE